MGKHRGAYFIASPHLIAEALKMPSDCEIVGVEWDFISKNVRIFVEGPSLPEVSQGEMTPCVIPQITVEQVEIHTWNWGDV